jgi:uncharacterized protein YqfA (UPF0365 family)
VKHAAHVLSRRNVPKVVGALIAAHQAGMDLPWRMAAAIHLVGRHVYVAVKRSVVPKGIDCPDPTRLVRRRPGIPWAISSTFRNILISTTDAAIDFHFP